MHQWNDSAAEEPREFTKKRTSRKKVDAKAPTKLSRVISDEVMHPIHTQKIDYQKEIFDFIDLLENRLVSLKKQAKMQRRRFVEIISKLSRKLDQRNVSELDVKKFLSSIRPPRGDYEEENDEEAEPIEKFKAMPAPAQAQYGGLNIAQLSAAKGASTSEQVMKRQSSSHKEEKITGYEPPSKKLHREEKNSESKQSKAQLKQLLKKQEEMIKEEAQGNSENSFAFNISTASASLLKNGTAIPNPKIKIKEENLKGGINLPLSTMKNSIFKIKHVDSDEPSPRANFAHSYHQPQRAQAAGILNNVEKSAEQSDYYKMAQNLMRPNINIHPNLDEGYI